MRSLILMLILAAGTASATSGGGEPNNTGCNGKGNPNSPCVVEVDNTVHGGDVNVETGDVTVDTGDVTLNNENIVSPSMDASVSVNSRYESAASTAYAYASLCGTGAGGSTREFSLSVSNESQYCKHLRMAAFYEGLFVEAKNRGDNTMAQLWYDTMVGQVTIANTLVDNALWTGAAKDAAADLIPPTLLCGGIAVVTGGVYGVVCAMAIAAKSQQDVKDVREKQKNVSDALYSRDTQFTSEKKFTKEEADERCARKNEVCSYPK